MLHKHERVWEELRQLDPLWARDQESEAWSLDAEYDIPCFHIGHRRRGKNDRILKKQCYRQRDI
jgi:hypothetical protein